MALGKCMKLLSSCLDPAMSYAFNQDLHYTQSPSTVAESLISNLLTSLRLVLLKYIIDLYMYLFMLCNKDTTVSPVLDTALLYTKLNVRTLIKYCIREYCLLSGITYMQYIEH